MELKISLTLSRSNNSLFLLRKPRIHSGEMGGSLWCLISEKQIFVRYFECMHFKFYLETFHSLTVAPRYIWRNRCKRKSSLFWEVFNVLSWFPESTPAGESSVRHIWSKATYRILDSFGWNQVSLGSPKTVQDSLIYYSYLRDNFILTILVFFFFLTLTLLHVFLCLAMSE